MDCGVAEDLFVGEVIKEILERVKEEMDRNEMTIMYKGKGQKEAWKIIQNEKA